VLWLVAANYQYPPGPLLYSNTSAQLWLFLASARTGELRWAQALSPAYGSSPATASPPFAFSGVSTELVTADLNGDGVQDVVVPAVGDDDVLATRALDGKVGSVLWNRVRRTDAAWQQSLQDWTPATVCDFEADGRPELVLVEPCDGDDSAGVANATLAVIALDATGHELWLKRAGAAFTHFGAHSHRNGNLLRPVAIHARQTSTGGTERGARKTSRVVVMLPDDPKLVSFDAQGAAIERPVAQGANLSEVFAADVDGDGQEELFFVDRGTLYATRADDLQNVLWKRDLGELGQQQILQLLPAGEDHPPLVVARTDVISNAVIALDAQSGQPVWTCPGPIARGFDGGTYIVQTSASLLGGPAAEPPLVCFHYDNINDCRQAIFTATQSGMSATQPALASFSPLTTTVARTSRVPAHVEGLQNDRRWKRDLPWRAHDGLDSRTLGFLAWSGFFAATLVVLPGWYIAWLVMKRRYETWQLLLLPVVAAIFIQAVLITAPDERDFSTTLSRLTNALFGSPAILGLLILGRWAIGRRWRRLGIWVLIMLAVSFAMAVFIVQWDVRTSPLVEQESFDWTGWYDILLPGAYVTSWLLIFSLPIEACARWLIARRSARSSIPPAASLYTPSLPTRSAG
jgi:outer membrane protein assembly factor BamB